MNAVVTMLRRHLAALRLLIALSVVLGVVFPAIVTAVAQIPGLKARADGSLVKAKGTVYGSSLLGQTYVDKDGNPLPQYFQGRPSAGSYDPTLSGASNLGPESDTDTLDDPSTKDDDSSPSLLTTVCENSYEVGQLNGVDGSRPYCATVRGSSGDYAVGAVLAVFYAQPGYQGSITRVVAVNVPCPVTPFIATYRDVKVGCATFGENYSGGQSVLVRGDAPAHPAVPADAVTASGSGLDPDISPAYATLQIARVAKARNLSTTAVAAVVKRHTSNRALGFLGNPAVNVLAVNADLDRLHTAG